MIKQFFNPGLRKIDTGAAESLMTETWRAAYELPSAWIWLVSGLYCAVSSYATPGNGTLAIGSLFCTAMSLVRFSSARRILRNRRALAGTPLQLVSERALFNRIQALRSRARKNFDPIWFGYGFDWTPEHAQKLYELFKLEAARLIPSNALLMSAGLRPSAGKSDAAIGWAALDGLNPVKKDIVVNEKTLEGGTLIVGTTQAGKGVLLTSLVSQAVWRGDTVIVIDPKNSSRLLNAVKAACRTVKRKAPFVFHPSQDGDVRINPLANFSRTSELASRITAVMTDSGPFTAFAWSAVHTVCSLLDFCGITPTIASVEKALANGLENLLLQSFEKSWGREHVEIAIHDARSHGLSNREAVLELARQWQESGSKAPAVEMGVAVYSHDPVHYSKITASLMPILAMLTSGSLRQSLSPEPEDIDTRPIMSLSKVLEENAVLYVCLNSLPDPTVASAIGSILLADLASCAGDRYNNAAKSRHRVSLFVDECSNVINRSLIEILNKGAESGIRTTCAMQTISDLASRLGDVNEARMALGNFNNLVSLRTKDRVTQDFVVETFGRAYIADTSASVSSTASPRLPGEFSSAYTRQLHASREEIIPPDILGKLPNCEYFASLAGGRLVKGRIPILIIDEAALNNQTRQKKI